MYIDRILELVIKPQLLKKQDFILENIVIVKIARPRIIICKETKKENNLEYFFKFALSLDISFIENCWQLSK